MPLRPIARPPKELGSFQDRKFRELLTRLNIDFGTIANLQFLLLETDPLLPNSRALVGSDNVSLADGGAGGDVVVDITDTGVTPGTYNSLTVDDKGRVTAGTAIDTIALILGTENTWTAPQHIPRKFSTKTTTYTITLTDDIIFADCTAGGFTINLPTAASASGRSFTVMKIDSTANIPTIDPNGAETICGAATHTILDQQWLSAEFFSNGVSWVIL